MTRARAPQGRRPRVARGRLFEEHGSLDRGPDRRIDRLRGSEQRETRDYGNGVRGGKVEQDIACVTEQVSSKQASEQVACVACVTDCRDTGDNDWKAFRMVRRGLGRDAPAVSERKVTYPMIPMKKSIPSTSKYALRETVSIFS